jgi:ribosomal protein L37E
MGLLDRLRHHEQPQETTCPRCGVPAPAGSTDCTACGWDLREAYRDTADEGAAGRGAER